MKILLRNPESGLFLLAPCDWTENLGKATSFPTTTHAREHSLQQRLMNLEIVMLFNDGSQFVHEITPGPAGIKWLERIDRWNNAVRKHLAPFFAKPDPKANNPFEVTKSFAAK